MSFPFLRISPSLIPPTPIGQSLVVDRAIGGVTLEFLEFTTSLVCYSILPYLGRFFWILVQTRSLAKFKEIVQVKVAVKTTFSFKSFDKDDK
uniref:Uncharacterized protein n=1 Tax=Cucumis melo TaxID=3656 RepID=A0A9I9EIM0_CUCME